MNYRLPFFATQCFLLLQVAYFRWQLVLSERAFRESFDGVVCLADGEGGHTFVLLLLLLINLVYLWKNANVKRLWWTNLTGLLALIFMVSPFLYPAVTIMWGITIVLGFLHAAERGIVPLRPTKGLVLNLLSALLAGTVLLIMLVSTIQFIGE